MKLHVFNAADGDCLAVETADRRVMLVDGGRSGSFEDNTAAFLHGIHAEGRRIDALCVSHIDADHITGVLKMLDLLLDRKVFEHHEGTNSSVKAPKFRMPEVRDIWHNGFEQQLGVGLASDVANALGTATRLLGALDDPEKLVSAQELAQSERQSAELSLQAIEVLGIPINGVGDGQRPPTMEIGGIEPRKRFGSARVTLLAPHAGDIEDLREQFAEWVEGNESVLEDLKREAAEAAAELAASFDPDVEIQRLVLPAERQAGSLAQALDNRPKVTTANLASIMLHVREGGDVALLTGDGHADDVIKGLEAQGLLDADEPLHVSVLKVPHHGSEFNIGFEKRGVYNFSPFLQRVTADHYVFCGDGSHHNPDQDIVKSVVDSRIGPASVRAANPAADGNFKLWFSTHPSKVSSDSDRDHMNKIYRYVRRQVRRSKGRLRREFLRGTHFTIEVGSAP